MDSLITRDNLHHLPLRPGVYFFYSNNSLLYIGKSISLRDRVRSHFYNAKKDRKEERLISQTVNIGWQETVGELGALLLESDLIKKHQPIYNRMLRKTRIIYALKLENFLDYQQVKIVRLQNINYAETSFLYGLSRSKAKIQQQLVDIVKTWQLCGKLTGIQNGNGPCFYYQLKCCRGACIKEEAATQYNNRLQLALDKFRIQSWPFNKAVIIEEKAKNADNASYHLIDKWCHVRTANSRVELEETKIHSSLNFDFDTYKILVKHLREYLA